MALDPSVITLDIYNSIVSHAQSSAGALIADGQDLAGVLLLISLGWLIAQWMLSGDGSTALMESFSVVARYSVVTLLLAGWLGTVGGFLQANVNDLSQKLSGTHSVNTSIDLMVKSVTKLFVTGEFEQRSSKCVEVTNADPATGALSTGVQCERAGPGAEPTWLDIIMNLPMVLFTWLLRLLAMAFLIMATAAFLLVIFMSEVLFGLSLAMGPVLVPWLIWQRTEWLFDGWLRFTVAACLTKVVAFFMVGITAGIVLAAQKAAFEMSLVTTKGAEMLAIDEIAAFLICITSAITAFMMYQVPGIAQALISGGSGVSAQRFGSGKIGSSLAAAPGKGISAAATQLQEFSKALKGK